jgi:hypothetical protein
MTGITFGFPALTQTSKSYNCITFGKKIFKTWDVSTRKYQILATLMFYFLSYRRKPNSAYENYIKS